ncbi:MAG: hypothetical protein EOS65_02410 [Mesorhizobium sp.]|uniref:hypothetical protein n=1 Tax=Mesorhizobium sp. TaxID=1871066 RepID=UPI000FE86F0C|nr:hypothetical protein [Mesorhizobium sp.]RWF44248.1 MAG: hypothetical protein EOS65_02410 [Mesorhizobium sp.]
MPDVERIAAELPVAWLRPRDIARLSETSPGAINAQIANKQFERWIVPVYAAPMPSDYRIRALLDELARQGEALKLAREVIRPFAEYNAATDPGDWASDGEIGEQIVGAFRRSIKLRDLRAARAFLSTLEGQ